MEAADLLQKRRIDGRTSWMFTTQSIKSDEDDTTRSIKSDDAKSDDDAAAPPFAERRTAHRGVGLYATRRIRAGERFIEEVPLATWCVAVDATTAEKARSFEQMQAGLPASTVAAILKLSQSRRFGTTQTLLGTWQTNGLPIRYENDKAPGTTTRELASRKEAGVFATICRLNHSCVPNVHVEWNGKLGRETAHALVDIGIGEELTICYLPHRGIERRERRAQLMAEHGFECACAKCELTGEALSASDARQRAVGALFRPSERELSVAEQLKRLDVRLQLMREEEMPLHWAWKSSLYYLASASMADIRREQQQQPSPSSSSKTSKTSKTSKASSSAKKGAEAKAEASLPALRRAVEWATRARAVLSDAVGKDHPASDFLDAFLHQSLRAGRG